MVKKMQCFYEEVDEYDDDDDDVNDDKLGKWNECGGSRPPGQAVLPLN